VPGWRSLADLLGGSVIQHSGFSVEPWCLRETCLDLEVLAQSESVFALSNGHIGLAGEPGRRGSRTDCPARI